MKKATSIRLFLVLATFGCCIAYGGGYYFSIHQSEKRMADERKLDQTEFLTEFTEGQRGRMADLLESAVTVTPYEFVLCEEEGYVIVYCADRETVYSNTDIRMNLLSSQLQEEIRRGKEIYSETELYNFLESHSS